MTPKEKADELVQKYKDIEIAVDICDEGNYDIYMSWREAALCALVTVEELINAHPQVGSDYWREVKKEIQSL